MTVTVEVDTVSLSIAALSISGVTIKDIDHIPDSAKLLCPLLIPQPNDYMSNTKVASMSFGSNGSQKINLEYDLQYVYLHCESGSGVNAFAPYGSLIRKIKQILITLISNDSISGLVDLTVNSISNVGIINDPAGNSYWGVLVSLHVLEHSQ